MYDKGKIIASTILFLIIVLSPLWYNAFTGKASYVPDLKLPSEAKQCVEDTRFMKANHMDLLNTWRENAVRKGIRSYKAHDGKVYAISLTGTCLNCHSDKEKFCDRCHDYVGVRPPNCWDCHNVPKVAAAQPGKG
jgi:hypothetical protein